MPLAAALHLGGRSRGDDRNLLHQLVRNRGLLSKQITAVVYADIYTKRSKYLPIEALT